MVSGHVNNVQVHKYNTCALGKTDETMRLDYSLILLTLLSASSVTKAEELDTNAAKLQYAALKNQRASKDRPITQELQRARPHLAITSMKPKTVQIPQKSYMVTKLFMFLLTLVTAWFMQKKMLPDLLPKQELAGFIQSASSALAPIVDSEIFESFRNDLNLDKFSDEKALQSVYKVADFPAISWIEEVPYATQISTPTTQDWHSKYFEGSPDLKADKTVSEFTKEDWNQLTDTYMSREAIENVDHGVLEDSEALKQMVISEDAEGSRVLVHPFLLEAAYRTGQQSLKFIVELISSVPEENRTKLYTEKCVGLYNALAGSKQYLDLVRRDGTMLEAVAEDPFFSDVDIIEISQNQLIHPAYIMSKFYLQDRPLAFNRFMARIPVTDQLKLVLWAMLDNPEKPSRIQLLMIKDFLDILFRRDDFTSVTAACSEYGSKESNTEYIQYITQRLHLRSIFNAEDYSKKFNKDPTVAQLLHGKMMEILLRKSKK